MLKKLVVLILLLCAAGWGLYRYTLEYLHEVINTPTLLFIPQGSAKKTIQTLQDKGIDLHWFDKELLSLYGAAQAGWIDVHDKKLTREAFFKKITHAKAALQKVTLIPGETRVIFFEELVAQLDFNLSKLETTYHKLTPYHDGIILAETYSVPIGIDEEKLITYLVNTSLAQHHKLANKYLHDFDKKEWFETIMIKASIVQKEAAGAEDMPLVAAVIENRLKRGMKLQMDGTLNYGKYSHVKVTAESIRNNTSKFNTYKYQGLPPYPVCSASIEAIEAVVHPADVDYLYFVRGHDGKHIFTNSYKEHLKNIK